MPGPAADLTDRFARQGPGEEAAVHAGGPVDNEFSGRLRQQVSYVDDEGFRVSGRVDLLGLVKR